jgi:hypothetical protein
MMDIVQYVSYDQDSTVLYQGRIQGGGGGIRPPPIILIFHAVF